MFGITFIKKEKLRRLALDYQTRCMEVKRLKEKLKEIKTDKEEFAAIREASGPFKEADNQELKE